MQVKIDTKEKIVIFTLLETQINANLAASLANQIDHLEQMQDRNLVLDFSTVTDMDPLAFPILEGIYSKQYDHQLSAAIVGLPKDFMKSLTNTYPHLLNVVPTLAEGIDMVMMEDFERALDLGDI